MSRLNEYLEMASRKGGGMLPPEDGLPPTPEEMDATPTRKPKKSNNNSKYNFIDIFTNRGDENSDFFDIGLCPKSVSINKFKSKYLSSKDYEVHKDKVGDEKLNFENTDDISNWKENLHEFRYYFDYETGHYEDYDEYQKKIK